MAGGAKIKKAAKKVKGLIGSVKGDANAFTSALGFGDSFSNKFDQRLKDGLSDLLGGALGIRMSQVPEISGAVLAAKEEARLARQKAVTKGARSSDTPGLKMTLQYPINYFKAAEEGTGKTTSWEGNGTVQPKFPNSIHFRTLARKQQDHSEGLMEGSVAGAQGFREGTSAAQYADTKFGKGGSYGSVNPAEEILYDIFLHLPEKVADEVKVEYTEAKAGALQQFFARMFSGGDTSETTGKRNFDMNEIMTMFKGMMPGGEIIQKTAGHMTNPMVFQTLKNVSFRSYSYSFQLKPTSAQEAEMINSIVFAFKKSMLPGTAGENNMIWTLPNEWAIRFQGPIADWVDFPLTAVCNSATVDYGPYLMAGDADGRGKGIPSSMTLTVGFIETAQLSRQKFANEVGATTGRKSQADAGTRLGALSNLSDEQIKQLQDGESGSGGEGGSG